MPLRRKHLASQEEFELWAAAKRKDTGDSTIKWQEWFGWDVPASYPAIAVCFWTERAGLIEDFWVEYVYPGDFLNPPQRIEYPAASKPHQSLTGRHNEGWSKAKGAGNAHNMES